MKTSISKYLKLFIILAGGAFLSACGAEDKNLIGFGCPAVTPLATTDEWRDPDNVDNPAFVLQMHEVDVQCLFDEGEIPTRHVTVIATARILDAEAAAGRTLQVPVFIARLSSGDKLETNFEAQLPLTFPKDAQLNQVVTLPRYIIKLDFDKDELGNAKRNEFLAGFMQTPAQLQKNRIERYKRLVPSSE